MCGVEGGGKRHSTVAVRQSRTANHRNGICLNHENWYRQPDDGLCQAERRRWEAKALEQDSGLLEAAGACEGELKLQLRRSNSGEVKSS